MLHQEELFTNAIIHIFRMAGYNILSEYKNEHIDFDFVAKNEENVYAIETKYLTQHNEKNQLLIERTVQRFGNTAKALKMVPVLVITGQISSAVREKYSDIIFLDTNNLLYVARNDQKTYDIVISSLPDVIDGIEPIEPDSRLCLNWMEQEDEAHSIIKAIEKCPTGINSANEFEERCFDALRYAFSNDLTIWKKQEKSNSGLFRFDLICRIKDNNEKSFWKIVEQFFFTKYIVFEFKNYSKTIKQDQVFTTERYLYTKALRTVGIIVSAKGADNNAKKAAKGILRETGKLILLLNKNDLVQMCNMRRKEDDPTNFLMDKLDEILFELEK